MKLNHPRNKQRGFGIVFWVIGIGAVLMLGAAIYLKLHEGKTQEEIQAYIEWLINPPAPPEAVRRTPTPLDPNAIQSWEVPMQPGVSE